MKSLRITVLLLVVSVLAVSCADRTTSAGADQAVTIAKLTSRVTELEQMLEDQSGSTKRLDQRLTDVEGRIRDLEWELRRLRR